MIQAQSFFFTHVSKNRTSATCSDNSNYSGGLVAQRLGRRG